MRVRRFRIAIVVHTMAIQIAGQGQVASENDGDDRVRAGDSTQVRTLDRALRVHRFVLKLFFGSAWISVRSMHHGAVPFYEF
jgi:hypothetical protein